MTDEPREFKIRTIEWEGQLLELREALPVSKAKFVQDKLQELEQALNKLREWLDVDGYMRARYGLQTAEEKEAQGALLWKKAAERQEARKAKSPGNKGPLQDQLMREVYGHFAGHRGVKSIDVVEWLWPQYPDRWSNLDSARAAVSTMLGLMVQAGKVEKEGQAKGTVWHFRAKIKPTPPEHVTPMSRNNLAEMGVDPRELMR